MASIVPLSISSVRVSQTPEKNNRPAGHHPFQTPLSLENVSVELPQLLQKLSPAKKMKSKFGMKTGSINTTNREQHDPIADLLGRVVLTEKEWKDYALFDSSKKYTRNLISTDNATYTLLLLCWNPGMESPIHDHPCDGCWMKVCQGYVQECRYVAKKKNSNKATNERKKEEETMNDDQLWCYSDNTYCEGQLAYITDSMGYHKVGNPNATVPAVTLHLYCPPFDQCRIWLDPDNASKPSKSRVCYHSVFGSKV